MRRLIDRAPGLFVALAASLWVADVYFRPALTRQIAATQIVFVEDGLITLCFVPVLLRALPRMRGLSRRTWLALIVVGVGPQAMATAMFTWALSFAYPQNAAPDLNVVNEVYLLYLAQPLFAIVLARFVLREKRRVWYWPLAAVALLGVYLVVFQSVTLSPFGAIPHAQLVAAALVLGAVALWGSGTVLGRYALADVAPVDVAAMRFLIALPVLLLLLLVDRGGAAFSGYSITQAPSFIGIVFIPGVLAMLVYYRALRGTTASTATIAELAYPAALFLALSLPPPTGLGAPLHPPAVAGALLLVAAVTTLNLLRTRSVVPQRPRRVLHTAAEAP